MSRQQSSVAVREGRAAPRARSRAWTRIALALTLVLAMNVGPMGLDPQLAQAAGPNPLALVSVTKLSDGTGHGTPSATFVNTDNDFFPGDDSDDDGVLASGDTATFRVSLSIQTGAARTITVSFASSPYLRLTSVNLAAFCISVPGVSARVVGDACELTVGAGVPATYSRDVVVTGVDTVGTAQAGQGISLTLGVAGQAAYSVTESPRVTVVSAPSADLMLLPYRSTPTRPIETYSWNTNPDASGRLMLVVNGLGRDGYSKTKGVSVLGEWAASVDVSAFPSDTTWTYDPDGSAGPIAVPMVDGALSLTGTGGGVLRFTIPSGWPDQEESSSVQYPVSITVDPASFSTDDYLNNGTGMQPGDGQPATQSTADGSTGALRGNPFANNDYSAVTVNRFLPPPGQVFNKAVRVPFTQGASVFSPERMQWDAAASEISSAASNPAYVAPGAQFRQDLSVFTQSIPEDQAGAVVIVADEWNPALQSVDPSRPVTVVDPEGNPVDPASYRLQWSTTATGAALTDPDESGWVTQDAAPLGARAMRVVFLGAPDATGLPVGTAAGAGRYVVSVSAIVRPDVEPTAAQLLVQDTLRGRVMGGGSTNMVGQVRLLFPADPVLAITNTVDIPDGQTTIVPGADVAYTLSTSIQSPASPSGPFQPTVTVTLDRCVLNPVNTSAGWAMRVVPGIPGSTGRVCGDDDSTPAQLVFTASNGQMAPLRWDEREQTATLRPVTYRVSSLVTASSTVANNADFAVTGIDHVASDDAPIDTDASSAGSAALAADTAQQDIGEPLTWHVDVWAVLRPGLPTSTVIALPRVDDGGYFAQVDNPAEYTGAQQSSFSGGYTLADASLVLDATTRGSALFYTTDPAPSLDSADPTTTWRSVDTDAADLAEATALRVDLPEGNSKVGRLRVTIRPVGNAEGDVYLLWAGETKTVVPVGESQPTEPIPMLWPAQIDVVAGTITGTVWLDENNDSLRGTGADAEPTVEGVEVGLFRVVDGQVASAPIDVVSTDTDGVYAFTAVHSGDYVTRVLDRGDELPATVTTHYGQTLPVDATFSYANRRMQRAIETSTTIVLPVGGSRAGVDFGYFVPNPLVDVDKQVNPASCTGATCALSWDVTLTNTGNQPIPGGTLTDMMSSDVYDVSVTGSGSFTKVTKILVGNSRGYALTADGRVFAWGSNAAGRNGNGLILGDQAVAGLVQGLDGATIVDVVTGVSGGAYALSDDGRVFAWGDALVAAQVVETTAQAAVARQIPALADVVSIGVRDTAGGWALTADGQVYIWGQAWEGGTRYAPQLVTGLPAGARIAQVVTVGTTRLYLITDSGRVYSGGQNNTFGLYGDGSTTPAGTGDGFAMVEVQGIPAGVGILRLVPRATGVFALGDDGRVYAWGNGSFGINGDGATTVNLIAAPVAGDLAGREVVDLLTTDTHAWALTADGDVYSWGNGVEYALGNGSTANAILPVRVSLPGPASAIASGGNNGAYAILRDGVVYYWGTITPLPVATTPAPVPTQDQTPLTGVTKLVRQSAGVYVALTASGRVYTWGSSPIVTESTGGAPTDVAALVLGLDGEIVVDVFVGGSNLPHFHALTAFRDVFSWGSAAGGALGNGATTGTVGVPLPAQGLPMQGEPAGVDLSVRAESTSGGLTTREYAMPTLEPGASVTYRFTGTVNQRDDAFRVLNQAWFTAPTTPIDGLDSLRSVDASVPRPPADPGPGPDETGIPGNATCNTDADAGGQADADSCDQVPVEVPVRTIPPGSITGVVWFDENRDGIRQDVEPVVPGAVVRVVTASGVVVASHTTGLDGRYLFGDLPAGDYTVRFDVSGVETNAGTSVWFTTVDTGGDDERDSDADPGTAETATIAVTEGTVTDFVDAGLVEHAIDVSVDKYLDAPDGYYTALPGAEQTAKLEFTTDPVTVRFTATNTGEEPLRFVEFVDTTAPGGTAVQWSMCYAGADDTGTEVGAPVFDAQQARWVVSSDMELPVGASFTCVGTINGQGPGAVHHDTVQVRGYSQIGVPATDSDSTALTILPASDFLLAKVAGDVNGALLGGARFELLADDAGEPGAPVAGVTVEPFDGGTTDFDPSEGVDYGTFVVGGIPEPGAYWLRETATPLGHMPLAGPVQIVFSADGTVTAIGEPRAQGTQDHAEFVRVVNIPFGAVSGVVWDDANRNGVRDDEELGLGGVGVTVLNADGDTVGETVSGTDGGYTVGDLPPGVGYTVVFRLDGVDIPASTALGFTGRDVGGDDAIDSDVDPATGRTGSVTVTAGQTLGSVDAGTLRYAPAVTVDKFVGQADGPDADPVVRSDDASVEVSVVITNSGTDVVGAIAFTDTTDEGPRVTDWSYDGAPLTADGDTFELPADVRLAPGDSLTVTGILAWTGSDLVHIDTVTVTATGERTEATVTAGDTTEITRPEPGSISGTVWHDLDADGVRGNDEPTVPGVVVTLFRGGSPVEVPPATTGADGIYLFTGLRPGGDYAVHFDTSTIRSTRGLTVSFTDQNQGDDESDSDVTATSGLTDAITVIAGEQTGFVDAGLIETPVTAALTVDKYFGNPDGTDAAVAEFDSDDDQAVSVRIANTGQETLTALTFADLTLDGPTVTGWACMPFEFDAGTSSFGDVTLDPGESITCVATLRWADGGTTQTHRDQVMVTARGATSEGVVTAQDTATARLEIADGSGPGVGTGGAAVDGQGRMLVAVSVIMLLAAVGAFALLLDRRRRLAR